MSPRVVGGTIPASRVNRIGAGFVSNSAVRTSQHSFNGDSCPYADSAIIDPRFETSFQPRETAKNPNDFDDAHTTAPTRPRIPKIALPHLGQRRMVFSNERRRESKPPFPRSVEKAVLYQFHPEPMDASGARGDHWPPAHGRGIHPYRDQRAFALAGGRFRRGGQSCRASLGLDRSIGRREFRVAIVPPGASPPWCPVS